MKRKIGILLVVVIVMAVLSGCTGGNSKGGKIRVIDSRIAEGKVILRMLKLLVEDQTDFEIVISDEMTAVNSYDELKRNNSDLFNSYDGTVLTTFLHLDVSDIPEGMSLYDFANQELKSRDKLEMLAKLGNNNTYAVAVRPEIAEKYNLKTISDLAKVAPEISFGAEHDFFSEEGNIKFGPFTEFYGLNFKSENRVDLGLKYSAIESNQMDSTVVYTTDGLNEKAGLVVLEDDRGFFPEYNGALVARSTIFEEHGENLKTIMNKLEGLVPNEEMVKLTYKVDVEMQTPEDVAKEYMVEKGLIK